MSKGARRSFNDPIKQLEALHKANQRVVEAFGGSLSPITGGGYTEITPRHGHISIGSTPPGINPFYHEYPSNSGWDLETLKKAMGEIESNKPEPVDPIEDWANKWVAENDPEVGSES